MKNIFKKADKSKAKLRLALFGISGSGKTFTALSIATGMSNNIALVDTERSSAAKYADRFEFDTVDLEQPTVENYIKMIEAAGVAGYEVLILDSMSHGWKELLDAVNKIARAKFQGNTWAAWSEGTPLQNKFIDALLKFNGHVIATMRSKTEWSTSQENGKTTPVRVGLAPEQGKGIEYEFDMLIEMSEEHNGFVLKDRTGKYQDKIIEKPNAQFGKDLSDWLKDGKLIKTKKQRISDWVDAECNNDAKAINAKLNDLTATMYFDFESLVNVQHIDRLFEKCEDDIVKFEESSIKPEKINAEVIETEKYDTTPSGKWTDEDAVKFERLMEYFSAKNNDIDAGREAILKECAVDDVRKIDVAALYSLWEKYESEVDEFEKQAGGAKVD